MSPTREIQVHPGARRRRRFSRIISLIIVAGLLSACADDSGPVDDRRFANEPVTRVADLPTPTDPPPPTPEPTLPHPGSPEALLNVEGAPDVLYVDVPGAIAIVDTVAGEQRGSIVVDSSQIVDFASSPSGDRVAVLTTRTSESGAVEADVVVFDRDGQEVRRWADLGGLTEASATPVAGTDAQVMGFISWGASGEKLLLSTDGTDLVSIEIAGDSELLPVPGEVTFVEYAAWSPLGDKIGLLSRARDGNGAIWVIDPFVDGRSSRQVAPPDVDASNLGSVSAFSWLPSGTGFAYILAADGGPSYPGGELFTFDLNTGIRLLVATAGRGGPAAQIVHLAVSPDGQSIAYTIATPAGDRWLFHSMWVRALTSAAVYSVPVSQVDRVDEVWWTQPGLVWRQQSGDNVEFVLKTDSQDPRILSVPEPESSATPVTEATPGASPSVSTPVAATPLSATLRATPVSATPVPGTPQAGTPVASPSVPGTPQD